MDKRSKIVLNKEADMMEDLSEYYESAGFKDSYNQVLCGSSEEQIRRLHQDAYENILSAEKEKEN